MVRIANCWRVRRPKELEEEKELWVKAGKGEGASLAGSRVG